MGPQIFLRQDMDIDALFDYFDSRIWILSLKYNIDPAGPIYVRFNELSHTLPSVIPKDFLYERLMAVSRSTQIKRIDLLNIKNILKALPITRKSFRALPVTNQACFYDGRLGTLYRFDNRYDLFRARINMGSPNFKS